MVSLILLAVLGVAALCWACTVLTGAPEAPEGAVRRGLGLHPSLRRTAALVAGGGLAWSGLGIVIGGRPVFAALMALAYACVAVPVLWALERRARRVDAVIETSAVSGSEPLFVPREWIAD